jgi:protocatechuate 3,4-dioxygenase beta subunit
MFLISLFTVIGLCVSSEISGRVLVDVTTNNPGFRDSGIGPNGVEILLFQGWKFVGKVATDADGKYSFAGLPPGTYWLRAIPPIDKYFIPGPDGTNTPDGTWPKPLVIAAGTRITRIDFGLKTPKVSEDLDIPIRRYRLKN